MVSALGDQLEFDKPLAHMTSFKTGGNAAYFISVNSENEMVRIIKETQKLKVPFFLIGGGSNLLVSDQGYDGLIIKVEIKKINLDGSFSIDCGAGVDLMDLVGFATDHSLTGLEFASGIWGTVGGAIYGNAGAYGGEIGDVITDVTLVDLKGNIKVVDRDYCRFGYRDSYLKKTKEIITSTRLKLMKGEKEAIKSRVDEIMASRNGKHPKENTCGCFFKNIPDQREKYGKLPAGRLLEEIGAKKMSVGGAKIFDKHANMIVNSGNATSAEISKLAELLKQKVFDKFGIELEEEVTRLGEFD
ncbi:MAG: UDP-N-acetylmuramate dehydrogenase [bacterium]